MWKTKIIFCVFIHVLIIASSVSVSTLKVVSDNYAMGNSNRQGSVLSRNMQSTFDQESWPTFQHDLCHTGYSTSSTPSLNNMLWISEIGEQGSSPIVAGSRVFVGSDDGLFCLNTSTGQQVWNCSIGQVFSTPTVGEGRVYVVPAHSTIHAVNETSGQILWNYTTGGFVTYPTYSSPALAHGKLFVGHADGEIYCLNASNGELVWNYTTSDWVTSSPAICNGKVFVASHDGELYCLDEATGGLIWNFSMGGWTASSPAIADDKVFIGAPYQRVIALNASTGQLIWNYTSDAPWPRDRFEYSTPAVAYDRVFIQSANAKIVALNASNGQLAWTYLTQDDPYSTFGELDSSPAVAGGTIFVGSEDHNLYALNVSDGGLVDKWTTSGRVDYSFAIADGKAFVKSDDGKVYAFGPKQPVHNLDTCLNYATIGEAINASETLDRHTIFVDEGTYYEHVAVSKSLSLIGENKSTTIIDGNGTGDYSEKDSVVYVTASNVTISGFTMRNSGGHGLFSYPSGICISDQNNCKVIGNIIEDNNYGIMASVLSSPSGPTGNTFSNNIIQSNNEAGILLYGDNNTITGNIVRQNPSYGVWLIGGRVNNTICSNTVSNNSRGISVVGWVPLGGIAAKNYDTSSYPLTDWPPLSDNNTIENNTVTHNEYGIDIEFSGGNKISDNVVETNHQGICIYDYSRNNTVIGNEITANDVGLSVQSIFDSPAANNTIFHNNFVNNTNQTYAMVENANAWDDGLEGNYWSEYEGTDANHDGIGDAPYQIVENNVDHYPLMGTFESFDTLGGSEVNIISNSSVEGFEYFESNGTIRIRVSELFTNQTYGFCRICIPHELMDVSNIEVVIDDGHTEVLYPNYDVYDNGTHRWIYFAYQHSTHRIDIIPEFTLFLALPLCMITTLLVAIVSRRKRSF
jgi:parallel beta-helix repeat protein